MPTGISNKDKQRVRQLYAEGKATRAELLESEAASYHSAGVCTFYGTANSNQMMLDLLEGDQTLFVRRDEVEAQWAWIDAIRAQWAKEGLTPKTYTAGTWGPSAAIALTERDGVSWHE